MTIFDDGPGGDDEDLSALLAAELDRAEGVEPAAPAESGEADEAEVAEVEAAALAAQARDDKGRFAKKAEEAQAEQPEQPESAPTEQPAPAAVAHKPPPGWSPAAKVAFDNLPAEVKEAVARREVEINQGFAKLAEYKGVEPFADMARQGGTTLAQALQNYVGIEQELRRDFLSGIAKICQNSGVDPRSLAQAILARNGGGQQGQGASQPAPALPNIQPFLERLQRLEESQQQRHQAETQTEIQKFGAENRFFDNVRPQMANLIRAGAAQTLQEAYEQACWANPEIRTLLIKEQAAGSVGAQQAAQKAAVAAQARASASKSIKGAPTPGAASQRAQSSIEDDIRSAWDASAGIV